MGSRKKISVVSTLHYIRLVYRTALFLMLLVSYIRYRISSADPILDRVERIPAIIYVTWAVFALEMIFRFFPNHTRTFNSSHAPVTTHRPRPAGIKMQSPFLKHNGR